MVAVLTSSLKTHPSPNSCPLLKKFPHNPFLSKQTKNNTNAAIYPSPLVPVNPLKKKICRVGIPKSHMHEVFLNPSLM